MNIQPNGHLSEAASANTGVARAGGPQERAKSGSELAGAASGLGDDTAQLSKAALLAAAATALPEVRSEKVAAVQQALASGSYAVSPSDVAGKLLDHLLER